MKTQKTAKQVNVIYTYKFNKINRICFTVLSSNEKEQYNTCFDKDENHGSCSCKGGDFHNCYHLDQLKARAAEYFQSRQPAQPVQAEKSAPVAEAEAFIARVQSEKAAKAPAPRQQEDWSSPDAPIYGPVVQKLHNSNEGHFEERSGRLIPMR